MVIPTPPKSNAQRQREFRRRHPDYYRLRYRKRKVMLAAMAAARNARAAETLALPAPAETLALPAMPVRLALPAPIEVLPILAPRLPERELVPVFPEINSFDALKKAA